MLALGEREYALVFRGTLNLMKILVLTNWFQRDEYIQQ